MSAKEFFTVTTVQDALTALFEHLTLNRNARTIPTTEALGQILASAPTSPISLPEFTRSTMDGYAVRAEDTFGASDSLPAYLQVVGSVPMGEKPTISISQGQTAQIFTGAMLPEGADAVVMVERTQKINDDEIEVLAPVASGENLVQIGEDVSKGAEILPAGHRLRPQDIGGLLAVGVLEVDVVNTPKVALLSSGDELVPPDQTPQAGQIRDINSYTLRGLMQNAGADVAFMGIASDTLDDLMSKAREGLANNDMLAMTAGSSVGTRDLTMQVIEALGEPGVIQHGLAVKPGKPTIIAVCDGKPVIGLPGNPVSAMLVARQIVLPAIRHLTGERAINTGTIQATLTASVASTTGREDTVPVRIIETDDGTQAEPIFGKSNLIYTLINANGLLHIPLNSNGIKAGTIIEVTRF